MINFNSYGRYKSDNYGAHTLVFADGEGREIYFSYQTVVAFWSEKTGLVCCKNVWSATTNRHLGWIQPDKSKRVDLETFKKLYEQVFGQKYLSKRQF